MDLGLSQAELRALSPARLLALLERRRELEKIRHDAANLRAGLVAATIANAFRSKGPPVKPSDFFQTDDPQEGSDYMTPEETAAALEYWKAVAPRVPQPGEADGDS